MTALTPGSRLGPYEITAKLGEGGMGLVYRAKDFHLGRDVALKVLPEGFTSDPERLARFEREAKLLAQLNHPNIAQIYGFEASGDARALVMELVEGPTLAERLEAGPLPFNECLSVSLQVAQALEEAHEKGIVHRDLKPQNIKASTEGKVKVLDFGLAKAMDPIGAASGAGSASQLAKSPTLTLGATVQGVILGTAAYMAPEQARGLPVDKRADIWAFGVVLYEMLSGRRLFEGELVSDVLAGVLRQEVDWSALPEPMPAAIRSLLRRCLERNPKNRLHDIADARIVIEEAIAGRGDEAPPAALPAAPPAPRSRLPLAAAAAGLLALGVAIGAFWPGSWSASDEPTRYFPLTLASGWKLADIDTPEVAISLDGRRRAVAAVDAEGAQRLHFAELGDVEWRTLEGTNDARAPFFSPDGRWIGYFNGLQLMRIAVDGGPPIEIAKTGSQIRGAVWLPDGTVVFSPDAAGPLLRVSEAGGEPTPLTTFDPARKERTHRWPGLLPDGKAVLFTADTMESTEYYDDANIDVVVVATGERKTVVRGSSMARFLPPDVLLFARGGSLLAVRFDPKRLEASGSPVPVKQTVATNVASGAAQFDTSPSGAMLWVPGGASSVGGTPQWVDRKGMKVPAVSDSGMFAQLSLAPDGQRLAVVDQSGVTADLWLVDLVKGTRTRLSFEGNVADPTWSADGERVAYSRSVGNTGSADIVWRRADGRGAEEPLIVTPEQEYLGSFSPDGRYLAYERVRPGRSDNDIWIFPLDGAGQERPFRESLAVEFNPEFSPDGRWLAYCSFENGRAEVFVTSFPSGDGRWQISTSGGVEPRWLRSGKELAFRSSGSLYVAAIDTSKGFSAGSPERLAIGLRTGDNSRSYSPTADGERFVALPIWDLERDSGRLNLALGWTREARKRLAGER